MNMPKRITLKEVAARASVIYQTVSKVISQKVHVSEATEQRIWDAVRELNYTPSYTARSLRSHRSMTIGYSWRPSPPDQTNPILDEFLQSMFRAAENHGYYLLCFPYHDELQKQLAIYRELINTGRVDAFVISTLNYNEPCVSYLVEHKFPFVGFGHLDDPDSFPYIDVDGALGLQMAVEHLLDLGHRRIAALAWPSDSRVGNNRMDGYFLALDKAGIKARPEWVERGEGTFDVGFTSTLKLLAIADGLRPTAIVAMNDLMAFGAMTAIQQSGLRPGKDIGVIGFDDSPTARYMDPPLTSIRQPISTIGKNLMERLIGYLDTGTYPDPRCELVAPELVIRESTIGKKTSQPIHGKEDADRR
jgi:DNA-binding LacI/PurR family transcriptional regulator